MGKTKRLFLSALLGVLMLFSLCFGVVFSMPTRTAKAETLSTTGWTLAIEGDYQFRIQNGNTYWTTNTNNVTTASMLDYTEINGRTLSEINAEKPGAVTVTLQPAGGTIGSFYRVNINTAIAGFTVNDIGTVVVRAGWSHTDANATYTIDTDLYFAHAQNKSASDSNNWKYIPASNVVNIADSIQLQDQGIQATGTRAILIQTSDNNYWTSDPITPNEGGGAFLNMLHINGESIRSWNKKAHAALDAGEISDISYGAEFWLIDNGPDYAPIAMSNSNYSSGLGSHAQVWIPTGYISNVSSFKINKGFANLQGDTLYYVEKDVEFVKSGSEFKKVTSSVDISDAFKILVQDYTASDGTMLYYLHTNNTQYWTQQYDKTGAFAINEKEWKGVADASLQGGAVQMSYIEFNGTPIYDINANDNGSYGATQGDIASGGKYAPILAFLTPKELGNAIKLQIPSAYPSGSGTAADNHKTITIKKGFYVVDTSTNIKYEVNRDIQWDYLDGAWGEHVEKIETNVTMAKMFGSASDAFAGIALEGSDYESAPSGYAGTAKTALEFARSANFLSHVLVDDVALPQPGEAFLNVWGNKGYFTFRTGNNDATKLTILAGCQFPTYKALLTGEKEVYVTTEDVTFVKRGDTWVKDEGGLKAGEYTTSIEKVTYARDKANNWMMFRLSEKDYPTVNEDVVETYNIATPEAKIAALNLYDKITVDGYTLRSRIATHGTPTEAPKINLWVDNCFAIRIAGCEGTLDGAQKVVIKAGAQFPSYAYITEGVEAYYVTTENITFVNVGAENGAWEREYTATFKADGVTVAKVSYTVSEGLTAPEVPEKEGYRGAWESYTANGDIIVNAVYTERTFAYEDTNISAVKDKDGFLILTLTNDDYSGAPNTWWGPNGATEKEVLKAMNVVDFSIYTENTQLTLGNDAIINVWGGIGNDLAFYLTGYGSGNMPTTVTLKKGCQFPSYAYVSVGTMLCYELVEDVTFNKIDGVWVREKELIEDLVIPTDFKDNYTLSDLYKVAYGQTAVFQDGVETLVNTGGSEADYRYGYVDSDSFTLSFDFKYTTANWYESFAIMFGTEGYNNVKACFGWRFFLLRGDDTNGISNTQCVQFFSGCDKGADGNGNLEAPAINGMYFVPEQTYHVIIGYKLVDADTVLTYVSIDGNVLANKTYDLTKAHDKYGNFSSYSSYMDTIAFFKEQAGAGTVTISSPGVDMTTAKNTLTLNDGSAKPQEITTDKYVLPALNPVEYDMAGNVFVGWTTDEGFGEGYKLYPAGYELTLSEDTELYPVWIGFKMRAGAAVRTVTNESGIRFIVDVDKGVYEAGKQLNLIKGIGTILAPTDYLTNSELTFALAADRYTAVETTLWQAENRTYSAAFINISYDQYARAFSARGYMKIAYTTGEEGYIYTAYDAKEHSRSIYEVATAAYKNNEKPQAVLDYVNAVADITIDNSLAASKAETAKGDYTVSKSLNDRTVTVTVNKEVKAVVINGVRVVMGEEADIVIGGVSYALNGYVLNNDGLTFTFTVASEGNENIVENYYVSLLKGYLNSTAYTAEHEAIVDGWANEGLALVEGKAWAEIDELIVKIESVKTAEELANNNTGTESLAKPTLSRGLGYTVTWTEVENADYYVVSDDNDYRDRVVVMKGQKLSYKAEVVGSHNITVTAHSYYEDINSATSNVVTTPEVKPVFTYKSMLDGLYKFSSSQMSTMGISTTGCYYDSNDKLYFVYYNKDTGWSPNGAEATDWTSPAEFPAHAQRLKDMGNNIILIAYDTNASYKAEETWSASRMRYVMDTAWSMGMKVLVCDEVFYELSFCDSDHKNTCAQSKAQVTTAINTRDGFAEYVTHPAFYGFSLDDEPYAEYLDAMSYTISALDDACEALGVSDPFYLACLFQSYGSDKVYTGSTLQNYYKDWLSIKGVDNKYLYVDIYTQHAMDYPAYWMTNRYENSFDAVYGSSNLGGKYKFYQAITSHTQNDGTLSEQDLYMSLLYAAAHDVAGYAWFCYFPIAGELAGTMVGYDGNGYGNGIGNKASGSYYNAAKTAGYQFELIQGLLDGYDWKTRSVSGDLLTTTLSNGTNTATMYVNADEDKMSSSVKVTASGSQCYLVGYGVGTAEAPYQAVSGSVTLAPGQAVICIA